MQTQNIDVALLIKTIIKAGAVILTQNEETASQNMTPEWVGNLQVLVPLISDKEDSSVICIGNIDLNRSHSTWINAHDQQYTNYLKPELFKNLILLKLYSDNLQVVSP
jgi:hypothetical protein